MASSARTVLVLIACAACGPNVDASDSVSGSGGTGTTAADPTTSTTSTTAGNTSTTSTTAGDTTTTSGDGSSFIMDTFAPDVPPGADCEPAEPPDEPPLPDGCTHAWLVDENSNPLEGAYSGIVRCASASGEEEIAYRTAAVACPELVGNDCLCDADCDKGSACICANEAIDPYAGQPAANRCIPADCGSADDCGSGSCRMDLGTCVGTYYPEAFRCTTDGDDCLYPSECPPRAGALCDYDEVNELFTCSPGAICE